MRVDLLNYELPSERIAQYPMVDRDGARLLDVLGGDALNHACVKDLPALIPAGALVVANDTRVIRARLLGAKLGTGGKVEIFLIRRRGDCSVAIAPNETHPAEVWQALGRASKGLDAGQEIRVGPLHVRILEREHDDGTYDVAVWTQDGESVDEAVRTYGRVPLPPYIKREAEVDDAERYQTTFARIDGAVAAPTAGLHLSEALIDRLVGRGCEFATVTLHVGLDTFRPVTVEDLDNHPMHAERYEVPVSVVDAVSRARARGAPVLAIGTTVVRALESAADPNHLGYLRPARGETRLLIQPGHRFQVVDLLMTNFHLPRSTLLALVCAFGGTDSVLHAYRTALEMNYRFCSYGDAMLLRHARNAAP